jgi:acetyl esterase/lipase
MQKLVCAFVCLVALACAATSWGEEPVESTQYGAKRLDFEVGDTKAFIILPTESAKDGSKPWVWYAPTFIGGHPDPSHEWMATRLLAAGFAIGGVEVGESYGSPTGTQQYSDYYEHVVKDFGLEAKPCLLPQSRGGLMLLNWAAVNPGRVQCVAGIYTVCNIESYPGAERAAEAYKVTHEEMTARIGEFNPLHKTQVLADAKIPHLFVHGDSDKVVPIEDNAGAFVNALREQGGVANIITVPGKGHEVVPEFFESEALVEFLLAKGHPKKE